MPGQGAIIGVGSIDYPAEWQAADPRVLGELGVVQGGNHHLDLRPPDHPGRRIGPVPPASAPLAGRGGIVLPDGVQGHGRPYEPVRFHRDVNDLSESSSIHTQKQIDVDNLINMYRVRGHLIAHLDPLDWKTPHMHPELDPTTHGLSVWDLDREFLTNGLAGSRRMPLGDILGILRDAYCRTVGVEYMHIQEPDQKRWIQEHVEGVTTQLSPEEKRWILDRLNATEALEQFLNTKFIGQKRFGLEGGESAIPLIDAILDAAAVDGLSQVAIGMAHRGRLNVLINIVGKGYGELFEEFEGNIDPGHGPGLGRRQVPQGRSKASSPVASGSTIDVALPPTPRTSRPWTRWSRASPGPCTTMLATTSPSPIPCCPCSSTATPLSPARASSPRPSTCRALPRLRGPVAPCTWSSTTSSASPPIPTPPGPRCTPPM